MSHLFLQISFSSIITEGTWKVIIPIFAAVLFLQAGLDKVFNYAGNAAYIKSVFEKTFLDKVSPILMALITVLEVLAGATSAFGAYCAIGCGQECHIASYGLLLSGICILCLFTGLRIAKDYAAATNLTVYFIFCLLGLFILQAH